MIKTAKRPSNVLRAMKCQQQGLTTPLKATMLAKTVAMLQQSQQQVLLPTILSSRAELKFDRYLEATGRPRRQSPILREALCKPCPAQSTVPAARTPPQKSSVG